MADTTPTCVAVASDTEERAATASTRPDVPSAPQDTTAEPHEAPLYTPADTTEGSCGSGGDGAPTDRELHKAEDVRTEDSCGDATSDKLDLESDSQASKANSTAQEPLRGTALPSPPCRDDLCAEDSPHPRPHPAVASPHPASPPPDSSAESGVAHATPSEDQLQVQMQDAAHCDDGRLPPCSGDGEAVPLESEAAQPPVPSSQTACGGSSVPREDVSAPDEPEQPAAAAGAAAAAAPEAGEDAGAPPNLSPTHTASAACGVEAVEAESWEHLQRYAQRMWRAQERQGLSPPQEGDDGWKRWFGLVASNWALNHPSCFLLVKAKILEAWEISKAAGGYPGIAMNVSDVDRRLQCIASAELLLHVCPAMSLAQAIQEVSEFGDINRALDFHSNRAKKAKKRRMHPSVTPSASDEGRAAKRPALSTDAVCGKLADLMAIAPDVPVQQAQAALMRSAGDVALAAEALSVCDDAPALPERPTPARVVGHAKAGKRNLVSVSAGKSGLRGHLETLDTQELAEHAAKLASQRAFAQCTTLVVGRRKLANTLIDQLAVHLNTTAAHLHSTMFFTV
eukprot:Rhum_TRINITY_DN13424_c0_g1::Rhum_TRINITY_DN13424_c0_g1_i1::g.59816::m.59816